MSSPQGGRMQPKEGRGKLSRKAGGIRMSRRGPSHASACSQRMQTWTLATQGMRSCTVVPDRAGPASLCRPCRRMRPMPAHAKQGPHRPAGPARAGRSTP
eukprot:365828-Chlamydomonas_euryale.AAC.3